MKRTFPLMIAVILCCLWVSGCHRSGAGDLCTSCDCANNGSAQEEAKDYKIIDSGRCSENVQWEIRSNGTLYIYGSGPIPNYASQPVDGTIAPWKASAVSSEITDIVVSDDITGIGEYAFSGKISSIRLGHSVITFGWGGYFITDTAYLPSSLTEKALRNFLHDLQNFSGSSNYPLTIYYEGTEAEFNRAAEGIDLEKAVIHCNATY